MRDKRRTERRDLPLAELAERQHGVVAARQLASLGYSRYAVSRAARVGRLHRIHRGVYAVGHRRLTWHGRCMAAVLAAQPAVASHETAGWIWGLLRSRPGIQLTAPTRRHAKSRPGPRGDTRPGSRAAPRAPLLSPGLEYSVHFARLEEQDLDEREAIPVTSLARTLLDLAATLSPYRLERALERAEELGLFDLAAIDELLARAGKHPGISRLRRALAIYRHDDPAILRSNLERGFRRHVRRAGLPQPSMNFNVAGFEVDAYWPEHRFAVELDAYETHGSKAAFERDRLRQEDLMLVGVAMTRITGPRLEREPEAVMARLERLLRQRLE